MELFEAIQARHCKRFFLSKAVPKAILEKVLLAAGNAASGKNSQPWEVAVIHGAATEKLRGLLLEKAKKGEEDGADYLYSIEPSPAEFSQRARKLGLDLFALKGIERGDKEKRNEHWLENYRFFGAPVVMIFHLPKGAERGNFLDIGQFLQNVMLGLVAEGLGSCPQASLCTFSKTIKEFAYIPLERILVCGLSVGYVDEEAKVNTFVPERLPLGEYVQWIG